ncbi:nucleotidyltransferase domain-containing protein [Candidatus Woesearchaeota archaeon]|nr:nucleotidyltransferase domain-containing protein [Candidatus Woesearchaeota archaeon]
MARPSKENQLLELFFNYPTKHWHFSELAKKTGLAESKLDKWLKRFAKEKLVLRKKPEKKRPHYISNHSHPHYQNRKKLFAMAKLYNSGLLDHLASLKKPRAVIIFGSFAHWDWYYESDIDLFIYGDDSELDPWKYEQKLGREFQIFVCKDEKELKRFGPGLLRNILEGKLISREIPIELIKYAARKDTGGKL